MLYARKLRASGATDNTDGKTRLRKARCNCDHHAQRSTFKHYFCLHANETLSRLEQTPKLVIAAINGHCVGGGLEVAMAADIRVARRGAGKMGLPEVSLGVLPGTGGTQRLVRIVGKAKAIELMATGQLFDFERGVELGLVNQVFETENFLSDVLEYARQFTTPN